MDMIYIKKKTEPKSLVEHRCTPGANFDGLDKTELRECLLKEQGYLCAYCMKRIRNEKDTKIEHYRARNSENQLEYSNLLAVCYGNQISSDSEIKYGKKRLTCDSMKGNQFLHINPQNKEDMDTIYYDNQGWIYSKNEIYKKDIENVLNLNDPYGYLIENRKAVIDAIIRKLSIVKTQQEAKEILLKWKRKYENFSYGEIYPEYIGVIRWYINKQLRKHGKNEKDKNH